ncbi:hypothetical protein SAMN05421767_13622 [Granulicatella balaenopterae]|uniref:Peptidase M16C associated domain-containing protein n=1 Tax=Granulicatella balaenopterae TaxID=137733 RepID=A0A1H9N9K6_9LACT|nr:insulinase family protein [Granulicatella balaenopterae]SER32355.1 hypothetical protein SAMN05421767_13622 [Granulicatella balaenopterae]
MLEKSMHHFQFIETKELPDIQSTAYLYRHEKTGGEVLYLKNKDDNKTFTISFATPPYDDNGICHIIEHSVLNGSKKYPTKEPFVELLKGSLNTFLNAMTYSDKTVYPVASRNEKDFSNLMSVYLDAVFNPNFYHDKQILMQEGWHYHLENKEDDLIYKGVVYNEMRGAFSQPESELYRLMEPTLYPDTIYQHISGGMPESIPTLTQEKFTAFHKAYYHPSNAKVILYGEMDFEKHLAEIAEYFDEYNYKKIQFTYFEQEPFHEERERHEYYSLSKGEDPKDKTLMSKVWSIGNSLYGEQAIAFGILEELLLGSNVSPLKKALLKSGLCSDVMGGYGSYMYHPMFEVTLKDTNPEAKDEFKQIITTELERLVKEGIPEKALQAALNKAAFRFKEATALEGGTPKGVAYGLTSLTSWLYGGSPYTFLEFQKYLDKINEEKANGYFENLIQNYLLDNKHAAVITLEPQVGLGDEREKALADKLQAYKESLTDEELDQLVDNTRALLKRQETPDSAEDLAKIPMLSRKDIKADALELPLTVEETEDVTYLYYEDFTAGIGYAKYYFDLSVVPTHLLPAASFLTELLGEVATTHYSEEELSTEIDFYTGGVATNTAVIVESVEDNTYYPKFTVSGKALAEYTDKLVALMQEISLHSKITDEAKVKEILLNTKSALETNFNYGAHVAAQKRLESYFSESAKYYQILEGVDYYDYIADVVNDIDNKLAGFIEELVAASKLIFTSHNVVATFTGATKDFQNFKQASEDFFKALSTEQYAVQPFTAEVKILNEGFKTAQEIQYVAKGYNQTLLGTPFNGQNLFMKTILGLDYFWNSVRVKGGAYGGMSMVDQLGNVSGVSYRDPNLVETLAIYDKTADYLANYHPTEEEFEKNLIGTFSGVDRPLSASQKGRIAFNRYFTHKTREDAQQIRNEILATTPEKIRNYAPVMQKIMDQNAFVVIGNAQKVENNKEIFGTVRNLFK